MKRLKKLSCLLLATLVAALCLFAFPTKANAALSGKYIYSVSNGEATITGCDLYGSGALTIPSALGGYPVTSIGSWAFSWNLGLTGVTIPDSVTTIGDYAFVGCTDLSGVTIGKGVTTIGANAFNSCRNLTSVTIPDSVTSVGGSAFYYCSGLSSLTIGNSVTSIGNSAFCYCNSLTSITIPSSVTNIDDWAFYACDSIQEVYYRGSRTQWGLISIGQYNSGLTSATIYYNCFPDVKSNAWYFRAVNFAVEKGYFSGNGDGTFAPGKNITRQDFVVVLSRIAGANLTQYSGKTGFTDVPSNAYYAKAIHWATENGIIAGYNATKFGVGDSLTREQLVTILSRYAQKLGVNVTPSTAAQDKMNAYSDANKINPYMENAVAWALQNKVISGMSETTIVPQGNATRAQVAAILMNINAYGVIPGI